MTDARAISAQLVDLRNVGTHKVVKLTVHVPEEQALRLTELFGWPTMVNPVPVALVRLNQSATSTKEEGGVSDGTPRTSHAREGGASRFNEMPLPQQAGILCGEQSFWRFLTEGWGYKIENDEDAAAAVRDICKVTSRSEIKPHSGAGDQWRMILGDYRIWQHHPELVP